MRGRDYKCIQNCCQKTLRPRHVWTNDVRVDHNEMVCEHVNWILNGGPLLTTKHTLWFNKTRELLKYLSAYEGLYTTQKL